MTGASDGRRELSDAKRRIVDQLKRVEGATAPQLAERFGLTDTAVRQHLEALETAHLVERSATTPSGRGRPPVTWRLSALAHDLFPDRHAELTVELVDALRRSLGDDALDRVLAERAAQQLAAYRALVGTGGPVPLRVRRLAAQRTAEGYLAEVVVAGGDVVLVEHHCPIAGAAHACAGLCARELETFQAALGDDVVVERTQHLVSGDARCAYRIRAA